MGAPSEGNDQHGDESPSETKIDLSRRQVLEIAGSGAIGAALLSEAGQAQERGPSDQYIVGVTPGRADIARERAEEVHRVLDFDDIGQAVSGRFPEEALDGLRNNPHVRYIEENGEMHALDQTTPWGVEKVEADIVIDNGNTGGGVSVAIIDTGIDPNHEDLGGNLGQGWAAQDAACQNDCDFVFLCPANEIRTCHEEWDDDNNHGTHVAGTVGAIDNDHGVVGVAPDVTLHAVKVLDCCGSGTVDDIAAGIEWSVDQGHDVQNMSLGGPESEAINDAVEYAANNGVVMIAAAGNDGPCTDCVSHPAAHPEVIAVSATSEDDSLADFSSTGPEIELAAPGEGLLSSIARDDYGTEDGTSMASPHVAGGAAQVIANGTTDREAVRSQLKDEAEDIGLDDNEQGAGRLNVANTLGNNAPEISVDNESVTVDEGDTATNSGSVSDPDSDPITLSATVGTVSKDGDNAWAWEYLTTDGPDDSQTVTITAEDDVGATSAVSFDLTVSNASPSVTLDLDEEGIETEPVSLSASIDDPGTEDTHSATVDWDDGTVEDVDVDQTSNSLSTTHTYEAGGTYSVELTVTDDDGESATVGDTVTVRHVIEVEVKPDRDDEAAPINPNSPELIPVGIYTNDTFDVSIITVSSLRFGSPDEVDEGAGATPAHGGHLEDLDDDGEEDLLVHFEGDTGLGPGDTEAKVLGETSAGVSLIGTDSVRIVGTSRSDSP